MPTREELLDAASFKLAEAVMLLTEAGEKRLAADAEELAELDAIPMRGKASSTRTSH
jgi:hypothetical protein